jgi:hypothetical protein
LVYKYKEWKLTTTYGIDLVTSSYIAKNKRHYLLIKS